MFASRKTNTQDQWVADMVCVSSTASTFISCTDQRVGWYCGVLLHGPLLSAMALGLCIPCYAETVWGVIRHFFAVWHTAMGLLTQEFG